MITYETVCLPGDVPPRNPSYFDKVAEPAPLADDDFFPEDDDFEYEYWDHLREKEKLSFENIRDLDSNPFAPDDLRQRIRDQIEPQGGRLTYETGEVSARQVVETLASRGLIGYCAGPAQRVIPYDSGMYPLILSKYEALKAEHNPLAHRNKEK